MLSPFAACAGLETATDQVFTDAAKEYDLEKSAQDLHYKLASDLCRLGNRGLHACDTHDGGYPANPTGKVDVILSTTKKPRSGQVRNCSLRG